MGNCQTAHAQDLSTTRGETGSNDTVSHMWEREGETVEGILRESG